MALWFRQAMLAEGWRSDVRITLADGRIGQVDVGVAAQTGDERHGVALPGLPNVHSHAFQRGMAGLAERAGEAADSFWTWREVMYRFVDRVDPDRLQAIAALAFVEMLESGFTRVGEFHYLHHDPAGAAYADPAEMARSLVDAARESGIGLTLLPVFYAHGGFGGVAPGEAQRRFISDVDGFARLVEGVRAALQGLDGAVLGIAPHSLRAVTEEELRKILPLAREGPVHIHVAEQQSEVDGCVAWSGQRPVRWLLDHMPVDGRWCLVHATHADAKELAAVACCGAVVGLCPITEANLGDGIFPARRFLDGGGRIGVGSDSNVRIDAAGELCLLEYGQRLRSQARNRLAGGAGQSTGGTLWRACLGGGAQALGQDHAGIVEGAAADLVSLREDDPALAAREGDALVDGRVFAGARIDSVWRWGRRLVRDGAHVARPAIEARYRAAVKALLA